MSVKLKFILVSFSAIFLLTTLTTAYATENLPTVSTVCETKSGNLYGYSDGFSKKKNCDKNDRRVILIGTQGQKGEKGEQGISGVKGDKGDPGEQGPPGVIDQDTLNELKNGIIELQNKVTILESNQDQIPLDVAFFNDTPILTMTSQTSEWYNSENYSKLVFTYQCKVYTSTSEYGAEILLLVSNDKNTSATVFSASKAECHSGGTITVDVAGKYYQVLVGNNTNIVSPPMTILATGRFR